MIEQSKKNWWLGEEIDDIKEYVEESNFNIQINNIWIYLDYNTPLFTMRFEKNKDSNKLIGLEELPDNERVALGILNCYQYIKFHYRIMNRELLKMDKIATNDIIYFFRSANLSLEGGEIHTLVFIMCVDLMYNNKDFSFLNDFYDYLSWKLSACFFQKYLNHLQDKLIKWVGNITIFDKFRDCCCRIVNLEWKKVDCEPIVA